jgi:hypothetical protein
MRRIGFLAPGVALATLLALQATLVWAQPAAAAGGVNTGNSFSCAGDDPSVIATYSSLTRVNVAASGGISCPTPQNQAPGAFGPPSTQPVNVPLPTSGPCHLVYDTPITFRLNGATPEYHRLAPVNGSAVATPGSPETWDPANPQWTDTPAWGWIGFSNDYPITPAMYKLAGTSYNYFLHWEFFGTWNAQHQCVAKGGIGNQGWVQPCALNIGGVAAGCTDQVPNVPGAVGPMAIGGIPIDLNGLVRGRFTGGQISSRPDNPNPGLVNVPTCFYVTGATVDGAVADPQQDYYWEQIVQGPDLGEGRHVYYVLLVHVSYLDTVWDFGDGTTATVGKGGSVADPRCGNVSGQQLATTHTYVRYSAGDGYHVTVTHHFGIDVSEMWRDGAGAHQINVPNAIPPVAVVPANQPYAKSIIQEEGVPVSTTG